MGTERKNRFRAGDAIDELPAQAEQEMEEGSQVIDRPRRVERKNRTKVQKAAISWYGDPCQESVR